MPTGPGTPVSPGSPLSPGRPVTEGHKESQVATSTSGGEESGSGREDVLAHSVPARGEPLRLALRDLQSPSGWPLVDQWHVSLWWLPSSRGEVRGWLGHGCQAGQDPACQLIWPGHLARPGLLRPPCQQRPAAPGLLDHLLDSAFIFVVHMAGAPPRGCSHQASSGGLLASAQADPCPGKPPLLYHGHSTPPGAPPQQKGT